MATSRSELAAGEEEKDLDQTKGGKKILTPFSKYRACYKACS